MSESLEYRVSRLLECKQAEEEAKTGRIYWEELVATLIPGPDSGSKTVTLDDGTKITVTRSLSYSADIQAIDTVFLAANKQHIPIKSKTTRQLDEAGYNWLLENDTEAKTLLSGLVVVTPRKTSVVVKAKR